MLCVQTSVREGIGNGNGSSSRRQWGKDEKGERSLGVCLRIFCKGERVLVSKAALKMVGTQQKKFAELNLNPMCYVMLMSKSSEYMPVTPHTCTNQLTDHNCSSSNSSSKSSSSSPNCAMVASVHSANLHYKVEKQQDRIERGSYNVKLIPSTFVVVKLVLQCAWTLPKWINWTSENLIEPNQVLSQCSQIVYTDSEHWFYHFVHDTKVVCTQH